MPSSSSPSLMFTVRRCQPELVTPATPTPRELKFLSDIDDQLSLRFQVRLIQVYRNEPSMAEKDPVEVLRRALSQTLVLYYPFAGRLREGPGRKLMVDCNGEGALFIEADADVTLEQFGDAIHPPFPCFKELIYDVPGSQEITNTPILLIQVTRLKCGGFILALRLNHTMCDAAGLSQFMNTWAQFSRGETKPSILPVWRRELLMARDPPRITFNHREYEQVQGTTTSNEKDNMVLRSFFFGHTDIAALRRLVPPNSQRYTTFDLITACIWRCRTKALQIDADEDVHVMVIVNARARFNPPLPVGYYGNAVAWPAAGTTAGKLCGNPIEYAMELINKVKGEVTDEYMHSLADFFANKRQHVAMTGRSFYISDFRTFNLREINFGWGEAVYGGPAQDANGYFRLTFYVPFKNEKGEEGILLPIWLPLEAMNRFEKELDGMLRFVSRL